MASDNRVKYDQLLTAKNRTNQIFDDMLQKLTELSNTETDMVNVDWKGQSSNAYDNAFQAGVALIKKRRDNFNRTIDQRLAVWSANFNNAESEINAQVKNMN